MFAYPITSISKEQWYKKVAATSMFTIPAQDEALPILSQITDILNNLLEKPIEDTLSAQVQEFFLQEVFPPVCSKIIKSRYFKNDIVLTMANQILGNCIQLYIKHFDLVPKFPGISESLITVLASDQYYFKTNNQFDYKPYPISYFNSTPSSEQFISTLKEGDLVDVIKASSKHDKLIWSRGSVEFINEDYLEVQYLNDAKGRSCKITHLSNEIAPFGTKSTDFEWRMSLKQDDVVDCQDGFGAWYQGTVLKVKEQISENQQSIRIVLVTFKVYDEKGNKSDEGGRFYGIPHQEEWIDVTTPKIMPIFSTCKYRNYEMAKSSFDTDDSNDMVITQIDGQKIYALPRRRALSEFYFKELNRFGSNGGYEIPIKMLQQNVNFPILCTYLKAIGSVAQYLHKQVVIEILERLKKIIQNHIFSNGDLVAKEFTKERSEMMFSGLKSLMKRMHSSDQTYRYENTIKMKLVSQCLDSEALKRKLQGLHELKDIVRSMTHTAERVKIIKNWVVQEKIFQKIYLVNSHVQLIKKSQDFFKFLIGQEILQVSDLERLYKIAQKGDYQSRISLYKLFQEMSYTFRKPHVDFLIDTILQSDQNVILNEDIDMLHELSRYSNYFPKQKVKDFFQGLILNSDNSNKTLTDYAIKKYAEIVSKGIEMKSHRRDIIKSFILRIGTADSEKIIKLLKCIFDGMSIEEWGKKDLIDILEQENIENLIVGCIKSSQSTAQGRKLISEVLDFFLFLIKLSSRVTIKLSSLEQIWRELKEDQTKRKQFIVWLNQVMSCDQGLYTQDIELLEQFYYKLLPQQKLAHLNETEFQLARSLIVEANKKSRLISVFSTMKDKQVEKEYTRLTEFENVKLLNSLQSIMFSAKDQRVYQLSFNFYLQLYGSRQNSHEQIQSHLNQTLALLNTNYENKNLELIKRTLKVLEMLINDSQKHRQLSIESMVKCRKGQIMNLHIINDTSYLSNSVIKHNLFVRKNISLLELKKKISQQLNLSMSEIKVMGSFQLIDYYNSYTLTELNLSSDYALTVTKKVIYEIPQQDLIIDGKMNPKAVRIFKKIFEKYASVPNGLSKKDYNHFTRACLGTISQDYNSKIEPIYQKYDEDKDGLLTQQQFIRFYTASSKDKPAIVWSNLSNLGVKGNFKFSNECNVALEQSALPRYKLYQNEQIYDMLFALLQEKEISKYVFSFLLRLPANQMMSQQIQNVWVVDNTGSYISGSGQKGKQALEKILTQKSRFRLFYKLILILNTLQHSTVTTASSTWNVKFSINAGYEIPFKILKQLTESKKVALQSTSNKSLVFSSIQLDIMELIFQIVKEYIYNSFGSKESVESSNLFEDECTLDEKMDYLLNSSSAATGKEATKGTGPASRLAIKRDYSFAYRYQWTYSKEEISELLFGLLIRILDIEKGINHKKQQLQNLQQSQQSLLSNSQQPTEKQTDVTAMKTSATTLTQDQLNSKEVCGSMTQKLMTLLSCLLVNQSHSMVIHSYKFFFDYAADYSGNNHNKSSNSSSTSNTLLTKLYTMILCICWYSDDDSKQQNQHIKELFKYISSKGITSQHFRILAFLVSKYGFKGENVQEIPQILLKNILQEQNQPTIEGCAKLLCNFNSDQLLTVSTKEVDKIFDRCLFGPSITCKQQQSRNQIYDLLIKLSLANTQLAKVIIAKTRKLIEQNLPKIKVTYSNQVNKRCSQGFAGLKNLGNICYMNSMLQQLYMNTTFKNLLLRIDDKKQPQLTVDMKGNTVDDNFLHQVQRIFAYLDLTTRQQFTPYAFCTAYKPFGQAVNIMMQQDVQEFVSMFFDRLQEGIKSTPFERLVQNFYTGKTVNLLKCHKCQQTKKIEDNFHSLSLEVKNSKSLSQSFERHILGEIINEYRCDFCQQKADVSKMSRISKCPHTLIIHLKRIVFNLDTFINQKITSRHSFPMNLNIFPYTLQYHLKQQAKQQIAPQAEKDYEYELTGIIVHIGNAESGHYISYIKSSTEDKWLQFNDALVSLFSALNIDSECFGGLSSTFDDDFDWEKKENSKSAYILIYTKKSKPLIQIKLPQGELSQKEKILAQLKLVQQIVVSSSTQQGNCFEKQSDPTESQEQSSSMFEDSEKERQKQKLKQEDYIREIEMIKHKKSEDSSDNAAMFAQKAQGLSSKQSQQLNQSSNGQNNLSSNSNPVNKIVQNDPNIITVSPDNMQFYMSDRLEQEVRNDNAVHFFQTSLASDGFAQFFAKLINVPSNCSEEMVLLCQKMMFGFWLKSKCFKQLLQAFSTFLKQNPKHILELVFKNENLITLLVQYSDGEVRSSMAVFLAETLQSYALNNCIEKQKSDLKIQQHSEKYEISQEADQQLSSYFQRLFSLIPTSVTKCWTKFNQYFEFWYTASTKKVLIKYLVKLEIVKHLVDYFLDRKSPLKIYCNKKVQQIGSSYVNPDFTMLLRCVSVMLSHYFSAPTTKADEQPTQKFTFTKQQTKVLLAYEFIQKLIQQGHQQLAGKMSKHLCFNNLKASQHFAVVLLKGFSKSTYQNIQRYIEVLNEYVVIDDCHQLKRMQWVLGKETLNVSTITKSLIAGQSHSLEERINFFDSTLYVQQGASFLQPIFQMNKRVENFCILSVQGILKICAKCKVVRDYVFGLGPPNMLYGRYIDSFNEFINRYITESKRSYYSIVTYFNKTELGMEVLKLYEDLMKEYNEEHAQVDVKVDRQQENTQASEIEKNIQQQQDQKSTQQFSNIAKNNTNNKKDKLNNKQQSIHESQSRDGVQSQQVNLDIDADIDDNNQQESQQKELTKEELPIQSKKNLRQQPQKVTPLQAIETGISCQQESAVQQQMAPVQQLTEQTRTEEKETSNSKKQVQQEGKEELIKWQEVEVEQMVEVDKAEDAQNTNDKNGANQQTRNVELTLTQAQNVVGDDVFAKGQKNIPCPQGFESMQFLDGSFTKNKQEEDQEHDDKSPQVATTTTNQTKKCKNQNSDKGKPQLQQQVIEAIEVPPLPLQQQWEYMEQMQMNLMPIMPSPYSGCQDDDFPEYNPSDFQDKLPSEVEEVIGDNMSSRNNKSQASQTSSLSARGSLSEKDDDVLNDQQSKNNVSQMRQQDDNQEPQQYTVTKMKTTLEQQQTQQQQQSQQQQFDYPSDEYDDGKVSLEYSDRNRLLPKNQNKSPASVQNHTFKQQLQQQQLRQKQLRKNEQAGRESEFGSQDEKASDQNQNQSSKKGKEKRNVQGSGAMVYQNNDNNDYLNDNLFISDNTPSISKVAPASTATTRRNGRTGRNRGAKLGKRETPLWPDQQSHQHEGDDEQQGEITGYANDTDRAYAGYANSTAFSGKRDKRDTIAQQQPQQLQFQKQNQAVTTNPNPKTKPLPSFLNHTQQQPSPVNPNPLLLLSAYHPVKFVYKPISSIPYDMNGVEITYHQSQLTLVLTQPTTTTNLSFKNGFASGISGKIISRIKSQVWKSQRVELRKGYFVENRSRSYLRVQTPNGCKLIKPSEEGWIWEEVIVKMWKCERSTSDWPVWSMYEEEAADDNEVNRSRDMDESGI